ncbi:hypothetical protein [Afipia clevelandensis]|nr:hypothetical protein [Afipia clevelandensis]
MKTMIDLTRPSVLHRIILAGGDSSAAELDLRRRGFLRVSTTRRSVPRGQYTIGLVTGQHSLQAFEQSVTEVSAFMSTTAAIAIVIDFHATGSNLKVRALLERLGFHIEAGVRCHEQFLLSARRRNFSHITKAA